MRSIGIDIGSMYTKYCVMVDGVVDQLFVERTPVRQSEYFKQKLLMWELKYPNCKIVSCGYGKQNVKAFKNVSELTALAVGLHYQFPSISIALDIGGQDTKLIRETEGKLNDFFVNDKCASGSGQFLANVLNILGIRFEDINLAHYTDKTYIKLSSVCAVFAQSEIVELMANDVAPERIVLATIHQILVQASSLLKKCKQGGVIALSGGLTQIQGIGEIASDIFNKTVTIPDNPHHLSAIGCAMIATEL